MRDPGPLIAEFLEQIGLEARETSLEGPTFVPGVRLEQGAILYDPQKLQYPGDLLHEAGHVAFTPVSERSALCDHLATTPGDEMAAIAWSYAAAVHIGLSPTVVFHEGGYRGESAALISNFQAGRFVGVSMLDWAGMTTSPHPRQPRTQGMFPEMKTWLRE